MSTAGVEAVWRIESARIVTALTRFTGDCGLAEDAAQEAVAEALVSWPLASPANPAGWLMATARRRAIDAIRRRTALQDRYALLAADPAVDEEIDPDKSATKANRWVGRQPGGGDQSFELQVT